MFKDTLQELLEAELDENLGYEKYEYSDKPKGNYRNGYFKKTVHSTAGDIKLNVPRDCNGEYRPAIVEKGEKDASCIVHMIRNTMNYVSYKGRKKLATDLKTIYVANKEEAYLNLQELNEK